MNRLFYFFFTVLFLSVVLFPCYVAADETDVDWSDPDSLDIYDPSLGDFLEIDTSEFARIAGESYADGDWEKAAKYFLAALKYDPSDGSSCYNLACCYGLLGEAELAAVYLERSYHAGFTSVEHIGWDPDFELVRETEIFSETYEALVELDAESRADTGQVVMVDGSQFLECNVMVPGNFNEDESYTLLVGLHGYGSSPDSFIRLYERFANPDFIYVTPRAPYPFMVGNDMGYSWNTWDDNDESVYTDSLEMTTDYVLGVVNSMRDRYNIDRVILMGFSQGCGMTYIIGLSNPDYFDGLICYGGWLDNEYLTEDQIAAASDLPIFIGHGTSDNMVEYEAAITARDYLIDLGYDVTFFDFDGAHSVPEEEIQASEEWMNSL